MFKWTRRNRTKNYIPRVIKAGLRVLLPWLGGTECSIWYYRKNEVGNVPTEKRNLPKPRS